MITVKLKCKKICLLAKISILIFFLVFSSSGNAWNFIRRMQGRLLKSATCSSVFQSVSVKFVTPPTTINCSPEMLDRQYHDFEYISQRYFPENIGEYFRSKKKYEEEVEAYNASIGKVGPVGIALGFFRNRTSISDPSSGVNNSSSLDQFARKRSLEYDFPIVTIGRFARAGLAPEQYKPEEEASDSFIYIIENAIKIAMKRQPGKIIFFNLDRFDPNLIMEEMESNHTILEALMILSNPLYMGVTAWFNHGREYTPEEVEILFGPVLQKLRNN